MNCTFTTRKVDVGYQHTCSACGAVRTTKASRLVRRCADTPAPPATTRGLGDTIAKGIARATLGLVKPCGGCKKRQAALNKLLPYK